MKLRLAKDLSLPLDAVTQTFLVVGKRGSGKSNTAARLTEQFIRAKLPVVVLDVTDTWWGLKASHDGGQGLPVYVFGGSHADLPLEAGGGALIADVLCEHRMPMILSVKHLSGRERSAFMVAFAQTLFQKWGGGPLHVVLEEAHELAPQMAGSRSQNQDNEAAMLGAFKRLWKLGRASGIGGTAVTQRPASLSKDITTQSEILIAHRTIGPQDVKAVGEWVKYHGEHLDMLADLPSLPTGEAFIWAPEFPEGQPLGLRRTSILRRETFDSASTPKVGEKRVEPKELAPVDLERLQQRMAATIEKAKADDPKELRRQIAELKKQVGSKVDSPSPAAKTVVKPVLRDADRALLEKVGTRLNDIKQVIQDRRQAVTTQAITALSKMLVNFEDATKEESESEIAVFAALLEQKGFQKVLDKLQVISHQSPVTSFAGRRAEPPARTAVARTNVHGRQGSPATPATLPPARQKILNALAFLQGIGVTPADKTQLALIVGVSPTSGGYFNNLGALRSEGFIEYPTGGTVALTEPGAAAASAEGVPETTDELHAAIRAKLPPAKWKLLEAAIRVYPNSLTKDALAEAVGVSPTSGGYFNNLGSLRSLGLITYPRPSEVAAQPVLFLEGR